MEAQDAPRQENRGDIPSVRKFDLIFLFWGELVPILY
jgi:hypothetical protein